MAKARRARAGQRPKSLPAECGGQPIRTRMHGAMSSRMIVFPFP